jgi:hypothetical protein
MRLVEDGHLTIPLYHGTSTLFLDCIASSGLGGANSIEELRVPDAAIEVLKLADQFLENWTPFEQRRWAFTQMIEQKSSGWNWQHGDAYLSPSTLTAIRYAIGKEFGSEFLSYTMIFIEEMVRREIDEVIGGLYQQFPRLFQLLDVNPSPMLVKVNEIPIDALLSERGESAIPTLEELGQLTTGSVLNHEEGQQSNFRLQKPVPVHQLEFFLICVEKWDQYFPRYNLFRIEPDRVAQTNVEGNLIWIDHEVSER